MAKFICYWICTACITETIILPVFAVLRVECVSVALVWFGAQAYCRSSPWGGLAIATWATTTVYCSADPGKPGGG